MLCALLRTGCVAFRVCVAVRRANIVTIALAIARQRIDVVSDNVTACFDQQIILLHVRRITEYM